MARCRKYLKSMCLDDICCSIRHRSFTKAKNETKKVRVQWRPGCTGIWNLMDSGIPMPFISGLLISSCPRRGPELESTAGFLEIFFPQLDIQRWLLTSSSEGLPLMPPTPEVWREWNGELGRVGFWRGNLWNGYHMKGRQQARRLRNPDTGRQCPEITMPGRFGSAAHANSIFLRAARSGFSWPGWDKQRAFCRSQPSIFFAMGKSWKVTM